MFSHKRRIGVASIMAAAFVLVLTACGGHTIEPVSGGAPAGSSPPATSGAPGTTSPSGQPSASAADQLAGFFSAAQAADARLHHAATLVNADIGVKTMRFHRSTLAAAHAIGATAAAHAIPGGMPPELLRQVLLVYSDLAARQFAFNRLPMPSSASRSVPVTGSEGREIVRCLGNGAPAAARFDADLAALRAYADTLAPLTVAAPDSRAAADVAVRVHNINGQNSCCGSCGGAVFTSLAKVVWHRSTQSYFGRVDGTINGVVFRADYHADGWHITVNAG
jgi:hypothetical protein